MWFDSEYFLPVINLVIHSPTGKRDSAEDNIVPEIDIRRPTAPPTNSKPANIDDTALNALANHLNSADTEMEDASIIPDRAGVHETFPGNHCC